MEQIIEEALENVSPEQVDAINEILLNTQEQCQIMEQVLKKQIETKDQLIDRLHSELEYYKKDQADRLINQAMKEVIKLRNDLLKVMESEDWKKMDERKLRQVIEYLEEDITDLLQRQDIEPFTSLPGELFDPSMHSAAGMVFTEDENLDHRIQKSKSPGYTKGDRVLIHEPVVVYRKENKPAGVAQG